MGYDTDGDGDCAICSRLPIINDRRVERLMSRVEPVEEFTPEDVERLRAFITEWKKEPSNLMVLPTGVDSQHVYTTTDHLWVPAAFSELKPGDIFRLFESDGTLIDCGTGHEGSLVIEPPELVRIADGRTWAVRCDPWSGKTA